MDIKLNIYEFLKSIIRHRVFIIIFVVIVSIAAVIFSLLHPKYWKSVGVVKVTDDDALLPGALKGLISSYSSSFGSLAGNEEAEMQKQIMQTREFSVDVIHKFKLLDYLEVPQELYTEDSLKVLDEAIEMLGKEIMTFNINEDTGTIAVAAETKDKFMSMEMVNYYIEKLDYYNKEVRLTKGKEKRIFLEERIQQLEKEIEHSSEELIAFQNEHNIIELQSQIGVALKALEGLLEEQVSTRVELGYMKEHFNEDNPLIFEHESRLKIIDEQIDDMQSEQISKYLPPLDKVNSFSIEYAKLMMKLELSKAIYQELVPQYEYAKLEEINNLTTIQYIQRPAPAGLRERPRRAIICIVSFILAIVVSCLASFTFDLIRSHKEKFIELLRTQ